MMKSSNAATVNSVPTRILSQAERARGREAVIFLERGEIVSGRLTYGELVEQVGRLAARLVAEGLSNRAVMISLPAGIPFVTLFLACLWARVVAIPAPYPAYLGNTRLLQRLQALLSDARPAAIVTDENGAACFASLSLQELAPRILTAAGLMEDDVPAIEPMAGDGDAPAIVQYTSGSTSAPRGVVITHANLFANQLMIESAFEHDHRAIGVSWLPHFHDMDCLAAYCSPSSSAARPC